MRRDEVLRPHEYLYSKQPGEMLRPTGEPFDPSKDISPEQWIKINDAYVFFRQLGDRLGDRHAKDMATKIALFKQLIGKGNELGFSEDHISYLLEYPSYKAADSLAEAVLLLPPDRTEVLQLDQLWPSLVKSAEVSVDRLLKAEYNTFEGEKVLRSTAPLALLYPSRFESFKRDYIDGKPAIFNALKAQVEGFRSDEHRKMWEQYPLFASHMEIVYPERIAEFSPGEQEWVVMKTIFNILLANQNRDFNDPGKSLNGPTYVTAPGACSVAVNMLILANQGYPTVLNQ